MTDEDEKAMKNKTFRRLLRKIGLKPPEDFNVVSDTFSLRHPNLLGARKMTNFGFGV